MFALESYAAVRRFVFVEGHSRREAAKVFGLSRDTVAKMCAFSLPPGYRRAKPPEKPKLGPLLPVIDAMLREDRLSPARQQHTAKRIFERLRDEHGYGGSATRCTPAARSSPWGRWRAGVSPWRCSQQASQYLSSFRPCSWRLSFWPCCLRREGAGGRSPSCHSPMPP